MLSRTSVSVGVKLPHRFHHIVERRRNAEDHRNCVGVVAAKRIDHATDRCDSKRAWPGRGQVIVWAVEEHLRVGDTILGQGAIDKRIPAHFGAYQAVKIVIVPRNTLALLSKDASTLVPASKSMHYDDLVPERSRGVDRCDARDAEVEVRDFVGE